MKLIIIKTIVNYFKAYFKLKNIELSIVGDLTKQYQDYQDGKNPDILDELKSKVDWMKLRGINGRTKEIFAEIEKAWFEHINKENNHNHEKKL